MQVNYLFSASTFAFAAAASASAFFLSASSWAWADSLLALICALWIVALASVCFVASFALAFTWSLRVSIASLVAALLSSMAAFCLSQATERIVASARMIISVGVMLRKALRRLGNQKL